MEPKPRKVEYYRTKSGKLPFREWLAGLNDHIGEARIDARITRLQIGQFGKCKPVGNGVYKLKDKFGPGYRIYYAEDGQDISSCFFAGVTKATSKLIFRQLKTIGPIINRENRSA